METRQTSKQSMRRSEVRTLLLVVATATVLSSLVLGRFLQVSASWHQVPTQVPTYVPEFRGTTGPYNVLAARGDVQGFAILYWDPLMDGGSAAGREESSYRAARPLLSYLAWVAMGGRHSRAAFGIILVGWLSSISAAAAVAALARSRGLSQWWGLLAVLLPGGLAAAAYGGADLLALTFVAFGLVHWPRYRLLTVAALTLGALSRETTLIVPAGIALHGLFVQRRLHAEMAVPFVAWMGWASIVHARYGAWPWESATDQRLGFHLSTLTENPANVANVLLLLFLVYVGLRRGWKDVLPWIALCSAGFLFVLGPEVLKSWGNFARVLLPGYVMGILAVITTWRARSSRAENFLAHTIDPNQTA